MCVRVCVGGGPRSGTPCAGMPQLVKALDGKSVVYVSCGSAHTAALTDSGDVYTWGCPAPRSHTSAPELGSRLGASQPLLRSVLLRSAGACDWGGGGGVPNDHNYLTAMGYWHTGGG